MWVRVGGRKWEKTDASQNTNFNRAHAALCRVVKLEIALNADRISVPHLRTCAKYGARHASAKECIKIGRFVVEPYSVRRAGAVPERYPASTLESGDNRHKVWQW